MQWVIVRVLVVVIVRVKVVVIVRVLVIVGSRETDHTDSDSS